MKELMEAKDIIEKVNDLNCPSSEVHRFKEPLEIRDICSCITWEIIEIISRDHIICKNFRDEVQEFGR